MMRALGLGPFLVFLYLLGPIVVIVGERARRDELSRVSAARTDAELVRSQPLADPRYVDAFATSLSVAIAATVLSLAIGLPAAYALARSEFPAAPH